MQKHFFAKSPSRGAPKPSDVFRPEDVAWVDDVVARPTQPNLMGNAIPGALRWYDPPDLRL